MPDPLYTARVPVRWGDQDALGHVNNTAYLRYVEQARIEFLESLADGRWPGYPDAGPILAAAELQFKRPIHYPATVVVAVHSAGPGRTSFPLDSVLTVEGDDETVVAEVKATLVWVDRATGRPTPIPDVLREALAG
ncbi:acyl-CoA thioesterase [Rubrivirga sp.]|uniref:acyl-CoA thioesterase n=1 Tax=Rubrivirga sp. TaxID=1885344 RepID=UPI003B517956